MPADIAQTSQQNPIQPITVKFPSAVFGSVRRSFTSAWFDKYAWLEYSLQKDAAFCFPCRFFHLGSKSRMEHTFISVGYRKWKHATGKTGVLENHDRSHLHKLAMLTWQDYKKNVGQGTSIANVLDSARFARIKDNRHYVKVISEILLLCARQNIAFRGHRESEQSQNRGNLLEILILMAKHDSVVAARLLDGPRNAIYTSSLIQNQILDILGNMVRKVVCIGAKEAGVFTILVDGTKDLSKKEQLSINLRYVDDQAFIREHFLTYVHAESVNAESLTKIITECLQAFQLDLNCIVSQGYNSASVMSGRCSGVQQRIKAVAPNAIYVHCMLTL